MQKPSKRQRKILERATTSYQATLSLGSEYLARRGVEPATSVAMRIGVVGSPEPGHEAFTGRLVIPYIDMMGVYGMKFRCMVEHECKVEGCSKYLALPGQEIGIYAVTETDSTRDTIHVTEGELDRNVLKQVFPDEPVVGVPGVNLWKPYHPFHFGGFERVLVWADGDKAGHDLANRVRNDVKAAEMVVLPAGMDVTDMYVSQGAEALRALVGLDEEEA